MAHEQAESLTALSPGEMLKKVFTDMYFGNGKPALTLRVAAVEDEQSVLKDTLEEMKKWQERMTAVLIGTLLTSVGGLLVIVVDMLRHH